MTHGTLLKIGAVVDALVDEFPDVSVSKLRFLEGEGLVRPRRTSTGYRQYAAADVERIRYILRQQRDHFLPLKVIRGKLDGWEHGVEPTVDQPDGPPPETYFAPTAGTMDLDELAQTAGAPVSLVRELIAQGMLAAIDNESELERFGADSTNIVRAAQRLVRHGLEPRHLRSIRTAANREVDLFRQLTGPLLRHPSPANVRQAAEVLADVAQAARELQETMVKADLRSVLGS